MGAAASTDIGASLGTVIELSSEREARRLDEARREVVADRVLWTASALGAAWLVLYAAATLATTGNAEGRTFLGSVVHVLPVALATVLSVLAARRAAGRPRRLWSLLVVANVLWLAGDLVRAGYAYLHTADTPFPSAADALHLASYAVVPAAVLVGFGGASGRRRIRSLLDAGVVGLGLAAAGWYLLIQPQLDGGLSWATATRVAYPLLGVGIVVTIASVALTGHRHVATSIWLLAAAFTVSSLTDAGYTYLAGVDDHVTGDWLTLGRQTGAVLLCLAAVCALRHREGEGQVAPLGRDLALVPVLLGVGTALAVAGADAVRHGAAATWIAVASVVVAGLVARFVLSVADSRRVATQLDADLKEQRRLAVTDGLTGLYNRRFFEEVLRLETERALRGDLPLALLVADLDHFKHVNDAHGHLSGDAVLVEAAARLRRSLRASDVLARYGGEEFVAILPDADRDTALEIAERCRSALADEPVRLHTGRRVTVTASFGVAVLGPDAGPTAARDSTGLLRRADRALYAAKDAGRDRVSVAPAGEEPRTGPADAEAYGALAPLELLAGVVESRKSGGQGTAGTDGTPEQVADRIGESLGLDADRRSLVVQAVRLRDVGMIVIGDALVRRRGPLTAAERRVLRTHPEHGARLVLGVPGQEALAGVVRSQHERWDGRGYPDGVAGPDLPRETRIVSVVAAWAAMLRPRPHRPPLSPAAACEELRAGRWTQFDGDVVDALLALSRPERAPAASSSSAD
ncbi:MAG TPA: diguanylate cyclase [Kineosporiaceae bacterium]|nr:diguanylate cyclase [Kineosporiaceae bacterium]